MATQISPFNSLTDLSEMYNHLRVKIQEAKDFVGLFPFIKFLTTINELKEQLISSLDKQYKLSKTIQPIDDNSINNDNDTDSKCSIRSLFISLYKFNGIPSDIMHANIISYLPSKDYKKF